MRAPYVICLLLLSPGAAWPQADPQAVPLVSGYVTRAASGSDFDVDGIRILCGPSTAITMQPEEVGYDGCLQTTPIVGQPMDVYGSDKKKLHAVEANVIEVKRVHHDNISGFAVIDAGPISSNPIAGAVKIRADGYRMLMTPRTRSKYEAPLRGAEDVMTNVWIEV